MYDPSIMCLYGTVLNPTSATYTQPHDNKHIVTFYDYKPNTESTKATSICSNRQQLLLIHIIKDIRFFFIIHTRMVLGEKTFSY